MTDAYEYPYEHAVLLLPGWRSRTGTLHIRRDCRAVMFHAKEMNPVLMRFDDDREVKRVLTRDQLCRWCFPGDWPERAALAIHDM